MKSWYDLNKEEQQKLKNEFSDKRTVIDLRIVLYIFGFIAFFVTMVFFFSRKDYYHDYEFMKDMSISIIITVALLFLAFSNSILISKNEKEFKSWLKIKNIEK